MDSRKRGSASPELIRALVDITATGSSIARLYAGLLAATLVEGNPTAHALLAKTLREQHPSRTTEVDDDDPPRPTLEQLRREAGRKVVRTAGRR
jgi:hypothetical protein